MADTPPSPPPAAEPPGEGASLREAIDRLAQDVRDLPAKLRVTLSPEDHRSIFEGLHGLFERAGAFERREEQPPDPPEEPGNEPEPEDGHDRKPGEDSLARRWFGHS